MKTQKNEVSGKHSEKVLNYDFVKFQWNFT